MIVKEACKLGHRVERLASGHWRITNQDGRRLDLPFSPGSSGSAQRCKRVWRNFKRETA